MPPRGGEVVFEGEFHQGPAATSSHPGGLPTWLTRLSSSQSHWDFPPRPPGSSVTAILAQLFLPEEAPVNTFGVTIGSFPLDLPVLALEGGVAG